MNIHEMIKHKNEELAKGAEKLREIGSIATGLENVNLSMDKAVLMQFCKLAGYKLRMLSYTWIDMEDESEKIPQAEEPTKAEIAAVREAIGDD